MLDIIVTLATLLANPTAAAMPQVHNPKYVDEVVDRWEDAHIDVKVESRHCGMENAWYTYKTRTVTLCDELFNRPSLVRFILNHELSHAFNHQHGLEWGPDEEFKADELAWFFSNTDEVLAGVQWFLDDAAAKATSADPHPPSLDRAAMLLCLDAGWREEDRMCGIYYRSAASTWTLIVTAIQP